MSQHPTGRRPSVYQGRCSSFSALLVKEGSCLETITLERPHPHGHLSPVLRAIPDPRYSEGQGLSAKCQAIRESARNRVRQDDQYRAEHERRAGMRDPQDNPLKHRIQKDAHEQKVRHGLEATSYEFGTKASMKENSVQVGRPSRARISQAAENAQDDRHRGLQDETESTGAGESLGNVLEERLREQIDPSP